MSITAVFRWFSRNFSVLLLSLALAVVVWVSAVTAADPNEERTFRNVPIQIVGHAPNVLLQTQIPETAIVTLFAPRSLLDRYSNQANLLHVSLNLTDLETDSHTLPLQVAYDLQPTRLIEVTPAEITVELQREITRTMPIFLQISGKPARNYTAGQPVVGGSSVILKGPEPLVDSVQTVVAVLNINNADQSISRDVALQALDASQQPVTNIQLSPARITINQPITLQGGYRNLVVKIVTAGQVANGYRLTNITITPPNIIVFSGDTQLVEELPGFIETQPLDLTELNENFQTRLPLNLPESVTIVGDQTVLVQLSIAAIESSLSITLPITLVNLDTTLQAQPTLTAFDVIVTGPLNVLENLRPEVDLRAILDLNDLGPGTYTLTPKFEILPEGVRLESFLPETVEVTITIAPTPTPTATPESPLTP